MNGPLWVAAPVILIVALATWADVRTRRIPNALTGTALLAGIAVQFLAGGPSGAGGALLGALIAGGILFPGWLMGFMGAGDVKLMAAVGAWLGFPQAVLAALVTLVAGGVIAVGVAMRHGVLWSSLKRAALLGLHVASRSGMAASLPTSGVRFPFAPAVLVGAAFVLWQRL